VGRLKIHIKNQLKGKVAFCAGMKEYELEPGQEVTIEVEDEGCMYFDQVTLEGKLLC
jgi:hypothetical protein